MDKNSVDWRGSILALVTPFDAKGAIDEAAFRKHCDLQIKAGVAGLLVCGCTGEFWALTKDERKRLYKLGVEAAAGRVPVIAGTGDIRTSDVIELSEAAKAAGCDGAMIMPPFFVKPSTDDVIAHYKAVSDAVKIPVLLYNIPVYNQTPLTPELVARLADIENVVGIKESSMDFNNFYKTILAVGDRLRVLVGPAGLMGMAAFEVGAPGYVEAFPNVWCAPDAHRFMEIVASRDLERARAMQAKAMRLTELMTANGRNYYASVKASMNILGLPGGYPRKPLKALGEPHLSELRKGLAALGFAARDAKAAE